MVQVVSRDVIASRRHDRSGWEAIAQEGAGFAHDALDELASAWRLDRRSAWRSAAVTDFRWDNRMRTDADKLMAEAARGAANPQLNSTWFDGSHSHKFGEPNG